ncbi:amino acid permease [Haloarcula sp. JP-Z28]|uniref:Amino acid permease n=1 Tax=Haloarcula marismortui (strain ATCC 43049 / DSM 3752 / JCM 8966 / VKM B-1809) TaxID=272569 RepID=Q5V402_HALMA|nr:MULTISPECIES: amino acid permease [Haloarcula]AAV45750.1 cationic amino acid transporter [Haloarcula marismortui ATCC 43049]NHN62743.1 amino acid permease [Haloarcula sp. JP-Z28]QCP90527.1 amino acid permease [Haloarcula marismortui ATCC 43049]
MSDDELAKDLGLVSAMTIGIGTMIGAGIFVLPGVAANAAGPVVVVSFVVGGLIAMVNALSVSELGTAMPKAGGGYYYINKSLGPLFGSIAGMGDWMGLAFASAFYCIGFGQYLAVFVPLPEVAFLNPIQIGALIAGAIFVAVNYIGAKETGGVQTVIVFILLSILTVFAVAGFFAFDYATLAGADGLAPFGTGAILPATALVFVSFLGYAKIATVAEELKNPGRNLPIAIIGSVGIVTVIYAILVSMMLGVVPWPELSQDAPVAQAAQLAFPESIGPIGGVAAGAAAVMTVGALLATASSANASILASARINFAMGRDKIVTNWLNEIHPNYATPYRSILVTGGLIIVFIAFLGRDIEVLAKAASVLHLIVYALLNVGLIVFRETDAPEYDPDFTVPLYPITPILGAVLSLGLVAFMDSIEIALSAGFVLVAVVWYFVYARGKTTQKGVLSDYISDREEQLPDQVVNAADAVAPNGAGGPTIMVALANPRTESALITLASALAQHEDGRVLATHIATVPDQTALETAAANRDRIDATSESLLDTAKADAEAFDVPIETKTILSHRGIEEVFDAARTNHADTVVMGYGGTQFAGGRAEGTLDELAHDLPCDFLVLDGQDLDLSDVLVPTAGGLSSDLSAAVAKALEETFGVAVSLLHVVDPGEEESGRQFMYEWAAEHGLSDAELRIETGDIEATIERLGRDYSLVIVGATERGLLSRIVRGSLVFDVIETLDTPVLLAERPSSRSLRERLFGRE